MTQRRITPCFSPVSSTDEEDSAESSDIVAESGESDVEEGLSTTTKSSKRKRSAKGDSESESERESTKKRRKVDVQQTSVEQMVVSDPVPFEKLDEPGPSGLQVLMSSPTDTPSQGSPMSSPTDSSSRGSNDSSPPSGLELYLGSGNSPITGSPSHTNDWHPPSPMHGSRETSPHEHAMELRPGIVKILRDTILHTIQTRLQRVKEERDAQEDIETENVSGSCSKLFGNQAPHSFSTPPESTNVWIDARRLSSIDSSLPSTSSTVDSHICSIAVMSSDVSVQLSSDSCVRMECSPQESNENFLKSQESCGPVGLHISEMQIDSPDISQTTITPEAPTNPESVSVQESKMQIDSPDNVTPVSQLCPESVRIQTCKIQMSCSDTSSTSVKSPICPERARRELTREQSMGVHQSRQSPPKDQRRVMDDVF